MVGHKTKVLAVILVFSLQYTLTALCQMDKMLCLCRMVTLSYQQAPHHTGVFEDSSRMLVGILSEQAASLVLWNIPDRCVEACEVFTGIEDWPQDWEVLLQMSSLLRMKHLHTRILWDMPRFLPIPTSFFQTATAQAQLALLHGDAQEQVHHGADVYTPHEMVVYWEVPNLLHKQLARHFAQWQSVSMAGILAGMLPQWEGVEASAHAILTAQCTWLVLARQQKPLWIHRLPHHNADAVVYALLNACALHGVSQKEVHVVLTGLVEEASPMYEALHAFFSLHAPSPPVEGAVGAKGQAYFGYLNTWLHPAGS